MVLRSVRVAKLSEWIDCFQAAVVLAVVEIFGDKFLEAFMTLLACQGFAAEVKAGTQTT